MNRKLLLRILSMTLLIMMIIPIVASCNKQEAEETETSVTSEVSTEISDDTYVPESIKDDWGGYQFKVLTRGSGGWQSNDITAELTTNKVDQAVYTRNATLEQKYNFKIVEVKQKDVATYAATLGASGERTYDLWSFAITDVASLGQEGYLYNLNEVKGINLDAPFYDQSARDAGSFANYLFAMTGDLLTLDDEATNAVLVNLSLYETLHLETMYGNIYDVVLNGEWTFEKMKAYANAATYDGTGDGQVTLKEDYWAGSAQKGHIGNFMIAFGQDFLIKNSDDTFSFNDSKKLVDDLQDILSFLGGENHYWRASFGGDYFGEGRQLFWYATIHDILPMKNKGIDIAIMPHPKCNEDQEQYYSMVPGYCSNCFMIPSSVDNIDEVANILELASYESMNTVTPALKEYILDGRIVDHHQDGEVLDMILKSKTYLYNDFWSTGGILSSLGELLEAGSTDVGHVLSSGKVSANASVQRKLERLQRLG